MKNKKFGLLTTVFILLIVCSIVLTGCPSPQTITVTNTTTAQGSSATTTVTDTTTVQGSGATTQIETLPPETITTTQIETLPPETITITVTKTTAELTLIEQLGKELFFDRNLSSSETMSCAICHGIAAGFTGPDSDINATGAIYPGAVKSRFGNRKPSTVAYGGDSPVLYYDEAKGMWIGGMFWDGRATGWSLGDPLAEQAQGPFLNPLEQNLPDAYSVYIKVAQSDYADLFKRVWGSDSLDSPLANVDEIFNNIARSISAYEKSKEVNPFSSKYDAYLAGRAELTEQEALGLQLFEGKAGCSNCHMSQPGESGNQPVFTNFTYDNLGMPKNSENPFYQMPEQYNPDGESWVDPGLGGFLKIAEYPADVYEPELGKHKVPTLRNIDMRPYPTFIKAYGHNGYFKSLEDIVHFFNTRDVEVWPSPEFATTVNNEELGNLGLTAEEETAIVAFLKTLSDGYSPDSPLTTTTTPTDTWGELAKKGKGDFTICADCHGPEGEGGGNAPQIIGNKTLYYFETAQRLFDFISNNMPQDAPGQLSDSTYLRILAFLLIEDDFVQSEDIFDAGNLDNVTLSE